MRRRALLASLPAGLASGLAGCAGLLGDVDPRRDGSPRDGTPRGATRTPPPVSFPYEAATTSGNVAEPRRIVVDHRGSSATFATVAVAQVGAGTAGTPGADRGPAGDDGNGGDGDDADREPDAGAGAGANPDASASGDGPRERTLAVASRSFEPGVTTLPRVAVARRGRYRVVAETAGGDRATGRWRVREGLGDLTVTLDDLAGVRLRQPAPATPDARGVASTGTVRPPSWPAPRAFTAPYGLRVTNATARTRDVTVDLDHDALALSYDYRVPPDVRLEFPPLPRTAPLRVRVASGGAAFRTVLNGQGVTLPLAVRADGVGFDPSVGRLDARVRVGPDGPWTIRLRVRDVEDRIVAERVLDLPSRSTRAVGGLVDAPGVYRVRVTARARERAADASGARVDERTVAVVARGRRVLDVDAGGGVRVRVDR